MKNKFTKKLKILFLGLLFLPTFTFAAFNDVTLTTSTNISVGGHTLNVTGASAVIQSIVINTGNFSVTLSSGSSIQITSPTYQQLSVDVDTFTASNNCADNTSVLTLSSSGASGTVTVTPQATICSTPVSSGGSSSGSVKKSNLPLSTNYTTTSTICNSGDRFSTTTGLPCTSFTPSASSGPAACTITTILKYGTKGTEVKCLQTLLPNLIPDGIFGMKTKAAVISFQKLHNLVQDGIVGPKTRASLASF